jgi:predicted lipoprotein with Yx(FWY)xxD motif
MALRVLKVRLAAIATLTALGVAAAVAVAAPVSLTVVHSAQNSSLGKILVSAGGRTLYHYSPEKKNVVKCVGLCAAAWPPLLVAAGAKPIAGPGVTASLLGTVKRPDGKLQVTYAGLALYLFSGDSKAGDVNGQGKGDVWHALEPTGSIVSKAVTASSGTAGGSSSGSSSASSSTSTSGTGTGAGTDCVTNPMFGGCM